MIAPSNRSNRFDIGPRHPLYPMLAAIALVALIFGPAEHQMADDMPEERTHPYFPDHFWPYPILAVVLLAVLGILAVAGQSALQPGAAADPRAPEVPRPEWYFLALFQFVKLGPPLLTSILVPAVLVLALLIWPLIDESAGSRLARRLRWRSWPPPKRNLISSALWIAVLAIIGLLTLWAVLVPQLCVPWFYNGPVCGS